jgi:moderate conductance mechanosensitive channel
MSFETMLAQAGEENTFTLEQLQWIRRCGGSAAEPELADPICVTVGQLTGSQLLANLAPALIRIGVVIVLAVLAHLLMRRAVMRFVRRLKERSDTRIVEGRDNRSDIDIARAAARGETIAGVLRSVGAVAIWTIALLTVLGELNINLGPLIAGAGIAGLALGFGAQRLVQDFLSGIFMLVEDQYGLGDIVDVGEAAGTIEAITLRTTRLRDVNGVVWYIPNGEIRRVGNKSQHWSRAVLDIGVAYDTDIDTAIDVIHRAAVAVYSGDEWGPQIMEEPDLWGVEAFGDSEITIRLVVKTKPLMQWKVARAMRREIKYALDAAGIEIPFPQRTVWLRNDEPAELTPSKHKGNDGDTAPA